MGFESGVGGCGGGGGREASEALIDGYGLRVLGFYRQTISDGEGFRCSIYLAGCRHRCPGCHNPQSWDAGRGALLDEAYLSRIVDAVRENEILDGITVTGGDPFYNPQGLAALLGRLKASTGVNVWCFTGYTIEEIARRADLQAPLAHIDVLVDGPFVQSLFDPDLLFRGSSNQRLIPNPLEVVRGLQRGVGVVPEYGL